MGLGGQRGSGEFLEATELRVRMQSARFGPFASPDVNSKAEAGLANRPCPPNHLGVLWEGKWGRNSCSWAPEPSGVSRYFHWLSHLWRAALEDALGAVPSLTPSGPSPNRGLLPPPGFRGLFPPRSLPSPPPSGWLTRQSCSEAGNAGARGLGGFHIPGTESPSFSQGEAGRRGGLGLSCGCREPPLDIPGLF